MSKLVRIGVAAAAAIGSVLAVAPGVVEAGISAFAEVEIPDEVTVGQSGIPVSVTVRNGNTAGDSGITNIVCRTSDTSPPCNDVDPALSLFDDRGINAIFGCAQSGTGGTCAPEGADPGVFEASATGTGALACAGEVFDIFVTNPVYDQLSIVPRTLIPFELAGGAECRIDFTVTVLKAPRDQNAAQPGLQTSVLSDNYQYDSTPGANRPDQDTAIDVTTVRLATPSISTAATASTVLSPTATATDTANVFDQASPDGTATVTFSVYPPSDPTCAGTPVFVDADRAAPANAAPLESAPFTPTEAGEYRWIASYSGDSNNEPASGSCGDAGESTIASPAVTTITTTASADTGLGDNPLVDTAVVEGRVTPLDGATVTFNLYGPDDATCANPAIETSTVPYPVAGGEISSAPFMPTMPGTYQWVADYSGDANNLASSGACGDEAETTEVAQATPVLITDAGDQIALGGELVDTATVTGRVVPSDTTIDFRLYGPDDATCATAPIFENIGVEYRVASTSVSSAAFTPTLPGVYRWVATYNGDVNNAAVVGECGDLAETVQVFGGISRIVTEASDDTFLGDGVPLTDVATVLDRVDPDDTGTIDFRLYGPNDDACAGTPIFENLGVEYPEAGGEITSQSFLPTQAGIYRWVASYSGDTNNSPSTGECGDPAETTTVSPTPDLGTELPETGPGDVGSLMASGLALLLTGLALVGFSSRRRRPTTV